MSSKNRFARPNRVPTSSPDVAQIDHEELLVRARAILGPCLQQLATRANLNRSKVAVRATAVVDTVGAAETVGAAQRRHKRRQAGRRRGYPTVLIPEEMVPWSAFALTATLFGGVGLAVADDGGSDGGVWMVAFIIAAVLLVLVIAAWCWCCRVQREDSICEVPEFKRHGVRYRGQESDDGNTKLLSQDAGSRNRHAAVGRLGPGGSSYGRNPQDSLYESRNELLRRKMLRQADRRAAAGGAACCRWRGDSYRAVTPGSTDRDGSLELGDSSGADVGRALPNIVVCSVTTSSIALTWSTPEYDGGSPVSHFRLSYCVAGSAADDPKQFVTFTADATCAFTIGSGQGTPSSEPLAPGSTVTDVTVVAMNSVGESRDCIRVAKLKTPGPPGPPRDLRVLTTTDRSFVLQWEHPKDDGGAKITTFVVAFLLPSGERIETKTEASEPRFTVGNGSGSPAVPPLPMASVIRMVRVHAVNDAGSGAWACIDDEEAGGAVALVDVPPPPPRHLIAGTARLHAVPLAWMSPPGPEITQHRVTYTVHGETLRVLTNDATPAFVIGGDQGTPPSEPLPPGTVVQNVSVTALTNRHESDSSNVLESVKTLRLCGPPEHVSVAAESGSTIRLEWLHPQDVGGSAVSSFKVRYSTTTPDGSEESVIVDTKDTTPTFTIGSGCGSPTSSQLPVGTEVRGICVSAVTRAGESRWSEPLLVARTLAPPESPRNVTSRRVVKLGAASGEDYVPVIPVQWRPPREGRPGVESDILHYVIRYAVEPGDRKFSVTTRAGDPDASGWVHFDIGSGGGIPASEPLRGVTCVRGIQVAAVNMIGQGQFSEPPTQRRIPTEPMAPQELRVASFAPPQLKLQWQPPPFDGHESDRVPVEQFVLNFLRGDDEVTILTQSAEPHFTLGDGSGSPACMPFQGGEVISRVRCAAINDVGRGTWSEPLDHVRVAEPASAPIVTVGDFTDTTIPLTWTMPRWMGGADLSGWVVRWEAAGHKFKLDTGTLECAYTIGSGAGTPASEPLEGGVDVVNVTVAAVTDGVGEGDPSVPIPCITPYNLAGNPVKVHVLTDQTTKTSIALAWSPPTGDFAGGITSYVVAYTIDGSEQQVDTGKPACTFVLGSGQGTPPSAPLAPRTTVRGIRVAAVTTVGTGPFSVATQPATTLGGATAPVAWFGNRTAATVIVMWNAPRDTGGLPVESYIVRWKTGAADPRDGSDPGEEQYHVVDTGSASNFLVLGGGLPNRPVTVSDGAAAVTDDGEVELNSPMKRGTPIFDVRVAALTAAGVGEPSEDIGTFATLTVPTPPQALLLESGDASNDGRIALAWEAPADDGGAPVVSYTVSYCIDGQTFSSMVDAGATDGRQQFVIGGGGGTPASVPAMPGADVSSISVAAVNEAGNSLPAMSPVTVHIQSPLPPPMGRPAVVRIVRRSGQLTVVWENPLATSRKAEVLTPKHKVVSYELQWKTCARFGHCVAAASLDSLSSQVTFERAPPAALSFNETAALLRRRNAESDAWPSWFEHFYRPEADHDGTWVSPSSKEVPDTSGPIQGAFVKAPPEFSYIFRVRALNGYGEYGPWSSASRPTYMPSLTAPRPQREKVAGLAVEGVGGGYHVVSDEIRRYILANIAADEALQLQHDAFCTYCPRFGACTTSTNQRGSFTLLVHRARPSRAVEEAARLVQELSPGIASKAGGCIIFRSTQHHYNEWRCRCSRWGLCERCA